jgi:adenylosuccinate lyase
VLIEFGVFPANIDKELQAHLPFLATTKILMAAVKNGMGREDAHEVIKEISTAVANKQRQGEPASLIEALAADNRLPLSQTDLLSLISQPLDFAGLAQEQCDAVIAKVKAVTATDPAALAYQPEQIR